MSLNRHVQLTRSDFCFWYEETFVFTRHDYFTFGGGREGKGMVGMRPF